MESLKSLLLWCFSLTAAFGLAGLVAPALLVHLNTLLGRWYSTRRALKPVEIPRNIDPFIYRHHKWMGALVVMVGSYNALTLLFTPAAQLRDAMTVIAIMTLHRVMLMGNALAIALGLLIYFRPSTLRRLEEPANRWVSLRPAVAVLEQNHPPIDRAFCNHPRAYSLFILLGSLYALTMTVLFL